jgi:predicted  nucleic acid-binding Zn ribbon protein
LESSSIPDKSISKVKDKDEKKVLELSVKVIKAYLTRTLENEKKAAIAFKALFKLTNTNNLEQLNEWEPPTTRFQRKLKAFYIQSVMKTVSGRDLLEISLYPTQKDTSDFVETLIFEKFPDAVGMEKAAIKTELIAAVSKKALSARDNVYRDIKNHWFSLENVIDNVQAKKKFLKCHQKVTPKSVIYSKSTQATFLEVFKLRKECFAVITAATLFALLDACLCWISDGNTKN